MTNFPFGFSPTGSGGGGGDFSGIPFFAELQKLMSGAGGPVNWQLAGQLATAGATSERPAIAGETGGDVADSLRLAELWLDDVTTLPAGTTIAEAWTRARWVEATLATWQTLIDPVAGRVIAAMKGALPAELAGTGGPLGDVMNQVGGLMFGMQVGQALGTLSAEVLSSTDVGLPIGPTGVGALLPENIASFGADLGVPAAEVQLYLALREAAYHRLFVHVPWLRGQLMSAVESYAQGITIDTDRMESAMASVDPTDPESLQGALSSGLFEQEDTPAQRLSLARLELLLALIEGWVDHVVDAAAVAHLPSAAAMRETVRRRRATGGPAEQTFATLVGLELRPRRLREAAALWSALESARGVSGRDDVWRHPDLLPDTEALDDPTAFVNRADDDVFTLGADEIDGPMGEDGPE